MTDAATRFVTALTFESLTLRKVFTSAWDSEGCHDPQHLRLTERADLFVIAPATANMIGKIANGIADDLVSTMVMSTACPVLLAPAMNTRMWENPIVQANVAILTKHGYATVGPDAGWLACRTVGAGRMSEPDDILEAAVAMLRKAPPRKPA
jgi:phosphopantothenoylcysteine decarboxylase/phosphopantothenate--cysteine ligase